MNYSIKQVSERFQISAYTLRYYERERLLPPIRRKENGMRAYRDIDLEWIKLIKCLRATGMSISDIRDFVSMCNLGGDKIQEVRRVVLRQKEIIEQQIKAYNEFLLVIDNKLKHIDKMSAPLELSTADSI